MPKLSSLDIAERSKCVNEGDMERYRISCFQILPRYSPILIEGTARTKMDQNAHKMNRKGFLPVRQAALFNWNGQVYRTRQDSEMNIPIRSLVFGISSAKLRSRLLGHWIGNMIEEDRQVEITRVGNKPVSGMLEMSNWINGAKYIGNSAYFRQFKLKIEK